LHRPSFALQFEKNDMKKGYWVVAYKSISESATKAYGKLAVPALESFGGRLLVRASTKVNPREADLQQRTVIVEFDSYENALAAYDSEAYKKALQALWLRRGTRLPNRKRRLVLSEPYRLSKHLDEFLNYRGPF
jgi:uncharacterized protein (DUF1330 family)